VQQKIVTLAFSLGISFFGHAQIPWTPIANQPQSGITSIIALPATDAVWLKVQGGRVRDGFIDYLLTSSDDGQNWQSKSYIYGFDGGASLSDIWALDAQTAWILVRGDPSFHKTLLKTTTGFNGFAPLKQPVNFTELVRFFDANEGVLVGGTDGTNRWPLYRTTDGGSTWTKVVNTP
jgi:hypothetical protein